MRKLAGSERVVQRRPLVLTWAQAASKALDNSLALLKSNYSNSLASNAGHRECKINVSTEQFRTVLHPRVSPLVIWFQLQLAFWVCLVKEFERRSL